jgi:uncharacterized protein
MKTMPSEHPSAERPLGELCMSERHQSMLHEIIKKHATGHEIWAYGSRVNGDCHEASDLDLVLRTPDTLSTPSPVTEVLREEFIESNIPMIVQILDWARIPPSFHKEILKKYIVLHYTS